jgi:glutaminyl-tRNA synthetase
MRRRGYRPEAIRAFLETVGIAKTDSIVEIELLEHTIRQDLNKYSPRVMGILDPLKVIITNYPAESVEELEAVNNPEDETAGTRTVPFSREIYIEREDFHENPPSKYYRLGPGREVRLRYGYFIKCVDYIKDPEGRVSEVHCTYDPDTKGGYAPDGRRVKGTLHWVSVPHAIDAEVRLYDRLFLKDNPMDFGEGEDFTDFINPNSMEVLNSCKVEPSLAGAIAGDKFQFERQGYFCVDPDTTEGSLIFNRTIDLRDTWARIQQKTPN